MKVTCLAVAVALLLCLHLNCGSVEGGCSTSAVVDGNVSGVVPEWAEPVPAGMNGKGSKTRTNTKTVGGRPVERTTRKYWFLGGELYRVERRIEDLTRPDAQPQVEVVTLGPRPARAESTSIAVSVSDECYFGTRARDVEDLSGQPLWGRKGPAVDDIRQGALGNCWFLASLMSVLSAPSPLGPSFIMKHTKLTSGGKAVEIDMWDINTPAKITVPYSRADFHLDKGRIAYHGGNWAFMWMKASAAYVKSTASLPLRLDAAEASCNPQKAFVAPDVGLSLPRSRSQCRADHRDCVSNNAFAGFNMILGPEYVSHKIDVDSIPSGEYRDRVERILRWASEAGNPMTMGMQSPLPSGCRRYSADSHKSETHPLQTNHSFSFQGIHKKKGEMWIQLRDPWGDKENSDRRADFLLPMSSLWQCVGSIYFVDTPQFLKKGGTTLRGWRDSFLDTFE